VGNTGGGAGGSGVVILSYPSTFDIRNGAGLTYTTSVVGSNKVTVFTAGTGNIQFASAVNSSFVLLETVTLTSAQASVEFANLNTKYAALGYQHLQIRAVSRTEQSGTARAMALRLNGDSGNNYAWHILDGDGSTVTSRNGTSQNVVYAGQTQGSGSAANAFVVGVIDLLDPFETTKNKTLRALGGSVGTGTQFIRLYSGFRNNTAAINSVTLYAEDLSSNFVIGSRFSIYGLKGS
jgi:hypothetical protein